jgi:hypothetical protein
MCPLGKIYSLARAGVSSSSMNSLLFFLLAFFFMKVHRTDSISLPTLSRPSFFYYQYC